MVRKALSVSGLILSWMVLGECNAFSQTSQGGISGRITDSSGAVVTGAQVVASNLATNVSATTTSNVDGYYVLGGLPIGNYKVTVTLSGFQTVERTPIAVSTAVNTAVDFELQPGKVTELVTVKGTAPLLQSSDIQISTAIQEAVVMDLPLQLSSSPAASGRRQIDSFIFLTPGVTGNQFSKSFNGSATFQQEVIIDGAIATGPLTPGLVRGYSPPYEAVQEFNVQNSMYPAEYPRGFGVINYNLKSGTNQLHGDAFEFLRNTNLDARSFFSSTVPITKQNEYGFTIGGPVVLPKIYNGRGKTFLFFGYTGFQLRAGAASSHYITQPTKQMLAGDFSQLLPLGVTIYDPATTRPDGAGGFTRDPFPGNIVPQARWDPSASKLLPYIPPAELDQPYNNFLSKTSGPTHDNAISIKMDHAITNKQNISFTYRWDWSLV